MPASQVNITRSTPLGAAIVPGGVTFRLWAPSANAVYVVLHDIPDPDPAKCPRIEENRLVSDGCGYWTGFFPSLQDGSTYRFLVEGPGGASYKRDPRSLELELEGWPNCDCVIRGAHS